MSTTTKTLARKAAPKKTSVVINARLNNDIIAQLDELGQEMQRSRSFLIAEAVQEYVEREYAHLCAVREGDADIAAGRVYNNEEIGAFIEELKTGKPGTTRPLHRGSK
jgi:predicted transcriptional regulator